MEHAPLTNRLGGEVDWNRGCAAAHRATRDCHPGGSEPYFQGPGSGLFQQKHTFINFWGMGTSIRKALTYKAVAIAVGNKSLAWTNVK